MADALEVALTRIDELEGAIRKHYEQVMKDPCWEHDVDLWSVLGISDYPQDPPPWCEFMKKCVEYRKSRE